jgi:hypothetical protein
MGPDVSGQILVVMHVTFSTRHGSSTGLLKEPVQFNQNVKDQCLRQIEERPEKRQKEFHWLTCTACCRSPATAYQIKRLPAAENTDQHQQDVTTTEHLIKQQCI